MKWPLKFPPILYNWKTVLQSIAGTIAVLVVMALTLFVLENRTMLEDNATQDQYDRQTIMAAVRAIDRVERGTINTREELTHVRVRLDSLREQMDRAIDGRLLDIISARQDRIEHDLGRIENHLDEQNRERRIQPRALPPLRPENQ